MQAWRGQTKDGALAPPPPGDRPLASAGPLRLTALLYFRLHLCHCGAAQAGAPPLRQGGPVHRQAQGPAGIRRACGAEGSPCSPKNAQFLHGSRGAQRAAAIAANRVRGDIGPSAPATNSIDTTDDGCLAEWPLACASHLAQEIALPIIRSRLHKKAAILGVSPPALSSLAMYVAPGQLQTRSGCPVLCDGEMLTRGQRSDAFSERS